MDERGVSFMKNKILGFICALFIFFPITVLGKEDYNTMNLDQALNEEGIAHDFSNYKETDDQAIIYMFRGNGCGYCKNFLTFLNSIVDEYGKYFRLVSYEVWNDDNNAALLKDVAKFLDTSAGGVPFIVIGEEVFPGYSSSYDEKIKEAIKKQYDSKNSYDVMKEMAKAKENKGKGSGSNTIAIVLWNFIFIAISTGIILWFIHNKMKYIEEKIENLNKIPKKETKKKSKA